METITLRETQLVCLDMLLAFRDFCDRHDLAFCLCGGTLLGAVRHRGFIPWDDDVDLFMARPDYERLIELCRTETIREDLEFACWKNGRFMRPFSRVYKKDSRVARKFLKDEGGANIWIDILPVDGMPADRASWPALYKKRELLNKFNVVTLSHFASGQNLKTRIKRVVSWPVAMLVGKKGWCRLLEHLGTKQDIRTSEYVGCITAGRYGAGEGMPREGFFERAEVTFEGRTLPAPACWDGYLSGIYGDYMTPPEKIEYNQHLLKVEVGKKEMERIRREYADLLDTGEK